MKNLIYVFLILLIYSCKDDTELPNPEQAIQRKISFSKELVLDGQSLMLFQVLQHFKFDSRTQRDTASITYQAKSIYNGNIGKADFSLLFYSNEDKLFSSIERVYHANISNLNYLDTTSTNIIAINSTNTIDANRTELIGHRIIKNNIWEGNFYAGMYSGVALIYTGAANTLSSINSCIGYVKSNGEFVLHNEGDFNITGTITQDTLQALAEINNYSTNSPLLTFTSVDSTMVMNSDSLNLLLYPVQVTNDSISLIKFLAKKI